MTQQSRTPAAVSILDEINTALDIEVEAIRSISSKLDHRVEIAVQRMLKCEGKIVVTGMGKSGHIGNKIAATLASTGSPAVFLHPAEAIHGDLGIVTHKDLVLALSNSGATEEIIRLLGPLRRIGATVISMTGNPESELASRADVNIDVSVEREACPLNLAPTASTTAALAMGDAIAVTLLKLRNFQPEDYALFHPGGSLGKQLVTTVADIMEPLSSSPSVLLSANVADVADEIRSKGYGITMVVDERGTLRGSFSLGDLLRLHTQDKSLAFLGQPVENFMSPKPFQIDPSQLAAKALHEMELHNIRALFVSDNDNKPLGIIGIYEILKVIDY